LFFEPRTFPRRNFFLSPHDLLAPSMFSCLSSEESTRATTCVHIFIALSRSFPTQASQFAPALHWSSCCCSFPLCTDVKHPPPPKFSLSFFPSPFVLCFSVSLPFPPTVWSCPSPSFFFRLCPQLFFDRWGSHHTPPFSRSLRTIIQTFLPRTRPRSIACPYQNFAPGRSRYSFGNGVPLPSRGYLNVDAFSFLPVAVTSWSPQTHKPTQTPNSLPPKPQPPPRQQP